MSTGKKFFNFISPHVHVDSLDSASTPEAFANRELELETGALTVTDHGTLQATRKIYDLTKDKKKPYGSLIPILGIEAYFRDDNCPILQAAGVPKNEKGTYLDFFKYGHLTLHCLDEDAYTTLCRVLSDSDARAEQHGKERKPLFNWQMLEELGGKNITVGSGCLIGMVQRFIMEHGRFDLAAAYYRRLRATFKPGNFFVEVFPHVCDRDWDSAVFIKFEDGSVEKFQTWKGLKTDKSPGKKDSWKAHELADNWRRSSEGHGCLRAVMQDRKWVEVEAPKKIVEVEKREGFILNDCQPWAPGGDLQYGCNQAVIELAKRYGDKILISDDCIAAGTLVRTTGGYKPVEHVVPGDEVVSHTGDRRIVEATRGLFSSKKLLDVHSRFGSATMTEDHAVWAVHCHGSYASGGYKQEFDESQAAWIRAADLLPGSWVFCPRPAVRDRTVPPAVDFSDYLNHRVKATSRVEVDRITISDHVHHREVSRPRYLDIDCNTAFVIGLFLGDGCAHNNHVTFALDRVTFEAVIDRVRTFADKTGHALEVIDRGKWLTLRMVGGPLAQWFRRNFYDLGKQKYMPAWVSSLPVQYMAQVTSGLFWSDGTNRNGNDEHGQVTLSMTSLQVVSEIREFLLENGVFASISSRLPPGGVKELYTLSPDWKFSSLVPIWGVATKPKKEHVWYTNSGYWFRIQRVSPVKSGVPVFDLQVPVDESFSLASFSVHNCHFVHPEEKVVQDVRLMQSGPWRFSGSHFRYSSEDAWKYFKDVLHIPQAEFEGWIENSIEWSQRFKDFKFSERQTLPTKFYPEDTWMHTARLIFRHGRMVETPEYQERLKSEIELLHKNGTMDWLPYFFLDEDVVSLYERKGLLTGPGRGSAAGLLLAYLLGITHVDPLKYGLSRDRFLTLDRIQSKKPPDIDQDLPERDDTLVPWLGKKFPGHFAQISVDSTLKLRSSVKDVARWKRAKDGHGGFVPPEIEELAKKFEEPPQGVSDYDFVFGYKGGEEWIDGSITRDPALNVYMSSYPEEWAIVQKCLGLSRQKGRHASAFIISNIPVKDFIPLTSVSDVTVTQFTAPAVEAAGGLKMDFLVVKVLRDLGACIRLIQKRSLNRSLPWDSAYQYVNTPGDQVPDDFIAPFTVIDGKKVPLLRAVPFKDGLVDIWDLPEDQAVFRDICEGKTETVFQFNTPLAKGWLKSFDFVKPNGNRGIDSIEAMAAFTALDRPGPLYAYVAKPGQKKSEKLETSRPLIGGTVDPNTGLTVVTDRKDPKKKNGNREAVPAGKHNMLVEYAQRAQGLGKSPDILPVFDELLPETFGLMCFQEQLQKMYQHLTGCTGPEAEAFRRDVSKKEMKKVRSVQEAFIQKAGAKIGVEAAKEVFEFFVSWGEYGFNASHAVCYSIIGYACAWLKHYYPLEWWTAVLQHADRKDIEEKFWPYCGRLVDPPDINLSGNSFEIQGTRIRAPLNLVQGIGPAAGTELNESRPYTDIMDFCRKVDGHKKATSTTTIDPEAGTAVVRAGRSALHKGTAYKLICSGVMDSLFPEGTESWQKLERYELETSILAKKRRPKPVLPFYTTMNPLQRYQLKKTIMAAYGSDLIPVVTEMGVFAFNKTESGYEYKDGKNRVGICNADGLDKLLHMRILPPEGVRTMVVAYVVDVKKFTYQGNRPRAVAVLDIEGRRFEFCQWPDNNDKLPNEYYGELKGAIVAAILSKRNADGSASLLGLDVLQEPLGDIKEEE